jgi:putative ABC transport system permease protein
MRLAPPTWAPATVRCKRGWAPAPTVAPGTPQQLIAAVRAVDPQGTFAMAAVRTPGSAVDEPPGISVDSTRLAAVATWAGGPDAAEVARELRPAAPEPVVIPGQDVHLAITTSGNSDGPPLRLSMTVSSVTGLGSTVVALGELQDGPYTYGQRVPACRQGCRIDGLQITTIDGTNGIRCRLTVTSLGSINPVRAALPATELADPARWRMARFGSLAAAGDGLRIELDAPSGLPDGAWIQPVDTPVPLPVAGAGRSGGDLITGLDGEPMPVTRVADLPAVPRLGLRANLTDLEYLDRFGSAATITTQPEIWLSRSAPPDVLDRLAQQGVVITGDTRAAAVSAQLDQQGPALAAAVDRARRVEDLSALRAQGLDRRAAGQATLWTYPILAVIAVLAGLGIALAGWALTGWTLPLAGLKPAPLPYADWPRPLTLVAAGLAMLIVLAGVALLTGRDLRRRVRAAGVNTREG